MIFKIKILVYLVQFYLNSFRIASRQAIKKRQQRLFAKLKRKIKHSRYYSEQVKSDAALKEFPIINKQIFMDNFNDINTVNIDIEDAKKTALRAESERDFMSTINGITIGLSSGTSGNKGIFLVSENERARWVAAILHRVIGFSLKNRKIAFFLRANSKLYESVKSRLICFTYFDTLSPQEDNNMALVELNPDILIGQPSVLVSIAKFYEKNQLLASFAKIISVAEVLDPIDEAYLSRIFKTRIDQVYQCTEGFLAHTCSEGKLHFNEDFIIVEKEYNNDKSRFCPIITDLLRTSQPVIRYRLNDLIVEGDKCACGSAFYSIDRIEGRADDVISFNKSDGSKIDVYPDFLRRLIIGVSDNISDYNVKQIGDNHLSIFLKSDSGERPYPIVEQKLKDLMTKLSISDIKIEESKSISINQGVKLRRISNEYHS